MAIRSILLLGNPRLYEVSEPVLEHELERMAAVVGDLHDTVRAFRRRHGAGRAVAAPQIGIMKRLIYLHIDEPVVFINPSLHHMSEEMIELWDDCMSFPELLVRVRRSRACTIRFRDAGWNEREMALEGDLSELLQHEYDHLNGILAVSRAVDGKAFALKGQKAMTGDRWSVAHRPCSTDVGSCHQP